MSIMDNDPNARVTHEPSAIRCTCLALRQAARRVTQLYDQTLAPAGIRATQLPILVWLNERGPLTMKALAEAMVMDRATLGHNLRPLETQGLVARTTGADRRERLVTLTADGRDRLLASRGLWREAQTTFESAFGREEAASLRTTLARVAGLDFHGADTGER